MLSFSVAYSTATNATNAFSSSSKNVGIVVMHLTQIWDVHGLNPE
jgi:hypothetical protein